MFRVFLNILRLATLAAFVLSALPPLAHAAEGRPADERPEPRYDPAARYKAGPLRLLDPSERVYRSKDGRYYCKRADGSAGLITGNIDADALGDWVRPGHSRTVAALIDLYLVSVEGQPYSRQNHQILCR